MQSALTRELAGEILRFQTLHRLGMNDVLNATELVAAENGYKMLVDGLEWDVPQLETEVAI